MFIIEHTNNKTQQNIEEDELLTDSIMFRLIQISENSSKLSEEFKKEHENIPWRTIKGMRNIIVHDYGVIDLTIVYQTIKNSIPNYYSELNKI